MIFSDNHILVVEKPAGLATQPELHEVAKAWVKQKYNKPGAVFLEPVHRLDKPVSGLVLFARTSKALSRLNEQMRERKIQKFYLAKVEGEVEEKGVLRHNLLHADHRAVVDKSGKPAVLSFLRLAQKEGYSLVEVALETGRYHQIRAQFGAVGHPVLGDAKYGAKGDLKKIPLHHHKIVFSHPTTKEILTFESKPSF